MKLLVAPNKSDGPVRVSILLDEGRIEVSHQQAVKFNIFFSVILLISASSIIYYNRSIWISNHLNYHILIVIIYGICQFIIYVAILFLIVCTRQQIRRQISLFSNYQFYFSLTNILIANRVQSFTNYSKKVFGTTNSENLFWGFREKYLKLLEFSKQTMKVFRYWVVGFVAIQFVAVLLNAKAIASMSGFNAAGVWHILFICWVCCLIINFTYGFDCLFVFRIVLCFVQFGSCF